MDISLKTYPAGDGKDKFNMCEINSSRSCGQIFSHLHILCCFSRSLLSVIFAYNFFSTTHVSSSFVFQVCDQHVMCGYILMSTNVEESRLMSKWSRDARIESDHSAILRTNGRKDHKYVKYSA